MYNLAISSIEGVNEGDRDTGTPCEGRFDSWRKRRELKSEFRGGTTWRSIRHTGRGRWRPWRTVLWLCRERSQVSGRWNSIDTVPQPLWKAALAWSTTLHTQAVLTAARTVTSTASHHAVTGFTSCRNVHVYRVAILAGTAWSYRFWRGEKRRRLDSNLRMRCRMASPSGSP